MLQIPVDPFQNTGEMVRELLEDFHIAGTVQCVAIVSRDEHLHHLRENVQAATVAYTLGLKSLDYAKRHYCKSSDSERVDGPVEAYIDVYHASKGYVLHMVNKLKNESHETPLGVYGAALALERLLPSFFCAHLLYRLGHGYEGHAVSRLILEQIAWAYAAYKLEDLETIKSIKTTKAISQLRQFVPRAGKVYGFLSKKTHIDYSSHAEFLCVQDGRPAVRHAQPKFDEYGRTMLFLADIFGMVWELSQCSYIGVPEAIVIEPVPAPDPKRQFLSIMKNHIDAIDGAMLREGLKAKNGSGIG
jgi:hypothetical protein